jgi:glycine/D-amino acid oxidase-like deaminating enzyme
MDAVLEVGEQVAARFPAYAEAGLASSWTGVYDVTPDWNPVLGAVPGVEGLLVAFGFSGHGFKLSPAVGRLVAQLALAQPTEVAADPYAIERFAQGRLLTGAYGAGAVS